MNKFRLVEVLFLGGLAAVQVTAAERGPVTIGTGAVTGNYFATGTAICQLLNRMSQGKGQGRPCAVKSTEGSIANVKALKAGELEFAIVQSDIQFNAARGLAQFKGKRADELRAVFSIYPEPLTILARKEAAIRKVEDFRGKRVSLGSPGSGTRATMEMLLTALKVDIKDLALVAEFKPDEHGAALCAGRIDGLAYVVGSPVSNIHDAADSCGAKLVSVTGPEVDKLVVKHPYLVFATIPGGMYPSNPDPVRTFGVMAGLVSSTNVPEQVVHDLAAAVFEHFEEFKKLHPAFAHLEPIDMISHGLPVPLHDGAVRYYREKGWIRGGD